MKPRASPHRPVSYAAVRKAMGLAPVKPPPTPRISIAGTKGACP